MSRESRRRLKQQVASAWVHFDKAAQTCYELLPLLNESDQRLGEMMELVIVTALEGETMLEELWRAMWGEPPEEIHPDNV